MSKSTKNQRHERELEARLCGHVSLATLARLRKQLGEGPMRFAPKFKESTIADQIKSLNKTQRFAFENVRLRWELKHPSEPFTQDMYLRFARCSPGKPFDDRTAFKVMKKYERRFQHLAARDMKDQLLSKAVFPIPKLLSIDGHEVLYMRPRVSANSTKVEEITDNLVYAVNTMMECEDPQTDGIACIANMRDWTGVTGFSTDPCFQLMSILQSKVPVRVNIFLIVNPPRSFGRIWNLTKPLLAPEFRQKVRIVHHHQDLSKYLAEGYLDLLPDDFEGVGKAYTTNMVADFVTYRMAVEDEQGHGLVDATSSSTKALSGSGNGSGSRVPRRGSGLRRQSSFDVCDRSVCSTNSHLELRRASQQRRSSELGVGMKSAANSGSSVCSSGSRQQRRASEMQGTRTTNRPPRAGRRASGSACPTADQYLQQYLGSGGSAELLEAPSSNYRPPRQARRASFGGAAMKLSTSTQNQPIKSKQQQPSKTTQFERRLSDIGARSNSITSHSSSRSNSTKSTGSNKSVTFEDATPRKSEFVRRLSGLGTSKAARNTMAPKSSLKRHPSSSTLATDAESTLTSN